ncbi:DNA polymerase [Mobilicoccus pelagius]|uniref:DNA-directed DNA polymerase n=1 Tax=Mobilicoccus pelagius NBRC 104925 TaxID=1089455 RepID=H5UMG8_9MICO|nr:DNA polymerase [Mobilicoccus pelagius]GAB46926.1 putative DNA polymerase [Mobilicoccus pelagius NBRC 104925]
MSSTPDAPPREQWVALVVGPSAAQAWGAPPRPRVAFVGPGIREVVDVDDASALAARLEEGRPRWVWWAALSAGRLLVDAEVRPARVWDVAEAHRLLVGGMRADPGLAWAAAHGLDPAGLPAAHRGDLLDLAGAGDEGGDETSPIRPDGYLRADAVAGEWAVTDERLLTWGEAALACARAQEEAARRVSPRLVTTVHSESAAAALCEELRHDGLPVDRGALLDIVGPLCGPPAARDAEVLRLVPDREDTDLRNPAAVKDMLASVGIDVPSTRKHVLADYAAVHPVVPALLQWRVAERIATTYGLAWIEEHIGPDDRLRGEWRPCDGGAGRMTAASGLHNLPAMLRPAVAAGPGHVFVRADLGQIEPRVLAVVSGDAAFVQATQADDLYAPVAARLGVERAHAKVAVLSAMYGGRAGAASAALAGLQREYPVAVAHLERAYDAGVRGEAIRTYGGRLLPTGRMLGPDRRPGENPELDAARGRFARNAIIQGAAAELFKAWAATVRATTRDLGARIVLCLHDELLVHVPADHGEETAARVDRALLDATRRWTGGSPARFVSDTQIVARWSEAKE